MSKHTPGPWTVQSGEAVRIKAGPEGTLAHVTFLRGPAGRLGRRDGDEAMANARLIAAAPDLYEALKEAERAIEIHTFSPAGHETPEERDRCKVCGENFRSEKHLMVHEGHPSDVRAEALRGIRAALARAEGKEG